MRCFQTTAILLGAETMPTLTSASSAGNGMQNTDLAAWLPGLGMFLAQSLAPVVSFPACPGSF